MVSSTTVTTVAILLLFAIAPVVRARLLLNPRHSVAKKKEALSVEEKVTHLEPSWNRPLNLPKKKKKPGMFASCPTEPPTWQPQSSDIVQDLDALNFDSLVTNGSNWVARPTMKRVSTLIDEQRLAIAICSCDPSNYSFPQVMFYAQWCRASQGAMLDLKSVADITLYPAHARRRANRTAATTAPADSDNDDDGGNGSSDRIDVRFGRVATASWETWYNMPLSGPRFGVLFYPVTVLVLRDGRVLHFGKGRGREPEIFAALARLAANDGVAMASSEVSERRGYGGAPMALWWRAAFGAVRLPFAAAAAVGAAPAAVAVFAAAIAAAWAVRRAAARKGGSSGAAAAGPIVLRSADGWVMDSQWGWVKDDDESRVGV